MNSEELEILRSTFLRSENGLISYLKNHSGNTDKIKSVLKTLRTFPQDSIKSMAQKKFEDIEFGRVKAEDMEKAECELALILMCVNPNIKEIEKEWNEKVEAIEDLGIRENGKVLIEIGAQHPLVDGKPGEEFAARLDRGIELYYKEIEAGNNVVIYIPGSTHSILDKETKEWKTDSNSLSKAGYEYLIEHGIPAEAIESEEANDKYQKRGVYNSGDEVFVATSVAKEKECGRVISVNSPVQLYRKALFYIQNGYKPEIHSVPLSNTYHNYVGELFWSLYVTYMENHTWQEGFLAEKTREERNCNFSSEVMQSSEDIRRKIYEILNDGLNLPENVYAKKAEWLAKYQRARENMASRANKPNLLIEANLTEENFEPELDILFEAISKANGRKCIICVNGVENSKIDDIRRKLTDLGILEEQFEIITGFVGKESEIYQDRECSDLYIVCPADKAIRKAIDNIDGGIIPQVFAVPSERDNFIKEISELYTDIFNERSKDSIGTDKIYRTFEDVDWEEIMKNEEER